jgi:hypothetical protein
MVDVTSLYSSHERQHNVGEASSTEAELESHSHQFLKAIIGCERGIGKHGMSLQKDFFYCADEMFPHVFGTGQNDNW